MAVNLEMLQAAQKQEENVRSVDDGGNGDSARTRKEQQIKASSYVKEYGSKAFYLKAKTNGDGKLTYSSSNHEVATVSSSGKVSVKKYGMAVVTVRASKTENYNAASKKITIKVVPRRATFTKVVLPGSSKIELKWKDDKTVTGYRLEVSLKSNFKSHIIMHDYKRPKERIVLTGATSKKTYYFRIRSYVKIGKNRYYGQWSKVRKISVK